MPTVIDSLFLELGIDVSRFSKDQAAALTKIQQFESQTKRAAGNARDGVRSVGEAFKDLANESRIGASAGQVEKLAEKFKTLGMSMQVAGGPTGGAGMMIMGLSRLLGPVGMGVAAVSLLGKEMLSLEKQTFLANTVIQRQSQLSDLNAKSLWSWGEAAKTVGVYPADVTGGISGLQTAIAGMGIGAADATPQLIALARLGVGYNFKNGMNEAQVAQLFEVVHQKAKASGYKNLGALRALTGPVMNDSEFAIATDPYYDPKNLKKWIDQEAPKNLDKTLKDSLNVQAAIGKVGIQTDALNETVVGGTQGLLKSLLDEVTKIADSLANPIDTAKSVWNGAVNLASRGKQAITSFMMGGSMSDATSQLMAGGMSKEDAAAIVGNLAQESSMNPLASNAGHVGIGQWDATRQADFARRFGYQMGSDEVGRKQQFHDQLQFLKEELASSQKAAAVAMAKARTMQEKVRAFQDTYERPGNNDSLAQRISYAQDAASSMVAAATGGGTTINNNVTSETHVQNLHIHTPSTDPKAHADAFRKGIQNPLGTPDSQAIVSLATRGMTG